MPRALICMALAIGSMPAAVLAQDSSQIADYEKRIEEQQQALDELRSELEAMRATEAAAEEGEAASDSRSAPASSAGDSTGGGSLPGPFVIRASDNLTVRFSGRIHRMLMGVRDGLGTSTLFTDSEQGPTMLRFDVEGRPSENLVLGSTVEVGIRQNRPLLVSQDNVDGGTSVTVRIAELTIDASSIGKLSFGRGFSAGWITPEIDLSGTQFASLLSPGMLAPGLKFADRSTGALSNIQVYQHFADLERLLLVDRVRFDSTSFGPGLQLSGSVAADSRWDVALRAKPMATDSWTVVGGATFQKQPSALIEQRADAGVSLRHNSTGLNLTLTASREELTAGRNTDGYLLKFGWLADLVNIGQTAFSVDYLKNQDLRLAGDRGESWSFFVVQKWPDFGTDFYTGIRRYEVDRPDVDLEPLNVFVIGGALRF